MKLTFMIVYSIIFLKESCEQQKDGIPECINQMITEYQNRSVQNPSGEFYEYEYKGAKVYYFKPPCCDQLSKLYDSNCNLICSPDGGITGKGDGKCPDFNSEKKNERLIWKEKE